MICDKIASEIGRERDEIKASYSSLYIITNVNTSGLTAMWD